MIFLGDLLSIFIGLIGGLGILISFGINSDGLCTFGPSGVLYLGGFLGSNSNGSSSIISVNNDSKTCGGSNK